MSFLSRKNSRSDRRGGGAADGQRADSEYDDYGYAPNGHRDDDSWSPDEYFSPEGIKGRWAAGARPGERPSGRGHREGGRGYDDPRFDDPRYDNGGGPQGPRGRAGTATNGGQRDAYQAGARQRDGYGQDLPPAASDTGGWDTGEIDGEDPGEQDARGFARKRRDRERGERRRRLGRRDRDDDIWPDDGVSDEDYWASVAADRPFQASGGLDDDPVQAADGRPMAPAPGAGRPADASRLLGTDRAPAGNPRGAGEQRTGSGRLGPAPGLSPAAASAAGQGGYGPDAATPGTSGRYGAPTAAGAAGPQGAASQGSASSGPMARSGTGSNAYRPAQSAQSQRGLPQPGFTPSPAQPSPAQQSQAQPSQSRQDPAQPSFQPNGARSAARQPGQADWADRTERFDRVTAAGYPDSRPAGRHHDGRAQPGRGNEPRNQDTPGRNARGYDSGSYNSGGYDTRGYDSGAYDTRGYDSGGYDTRGYDSGAYDTRGYDSGGYDTRGYDSGAYDTRGYGSGGYPAQPQGRARRSGADDDPLTSKAYSRNALTDTDGRSYAVARRSHAPADRREAALNEETQTFSMTTGSFQADPQPAVARHPGHGGQQPGQNPYDLGTTGAYPYPVGQPAPARPAQDDRHRSARPAGQGRGGYGTGGYAGRR